MPCLQMNQNRSLSWNSFGFVAKAQEKSKEVEEVKASTSVSTDDYTGYIPDPPSIPVDDVILTSLGEPTLNSLGLGSYYTPVGWVQNSMEFLHTHFDMPWFAAISLTCLVLRALMIRVTIQIQKNAATMKVIGADMKEIQEKISEAKIKGNKLEEHMLTYKLVEFMKKNGYSIGGQIFPMLTQGLVFTSAFWGIRSMCNLPVESMRLGGVSWFTDLTLTDPYFILPVVSISTLVYNLEKGLEMGTGTDAMTHTAKWVMRAFMAPLLYYFAFHAPAGLMCYIVTSNLCTVAISRITRLDAVRRRYNIPTISEDKERMLREKKDTKGFLEGFKESMARMKQMKEIENRDRLRAEILKRAGSKIVKTYKENPQLKAKQAGTN